MKVADAAREGRTRTVEVAITDCCKRWAMEHPDEVVALSQKVKDLRSGALRKNAISEYKHFLHKAEIPTTLYYKMKEEIDPGWLDNPEIRRVFHSVFKIGLVNLHSETNA